MTRDLSLNRLPRRSAAGDAALVAVFALIAVAQLAGGATAAEASVATATRDDLVVTVGMSAGSSRPTLRARSSSRPEAARQPRRRHPPPRRAAPPRIPTRSSHARAAGCPGTWSSRARTCGPAAARCARRRAVVGSSARPGEATSRRLTSSCGRSAPAILFGASRRRRPSSGGTARGHLGAVAALAATRRPRPAEHRRSAARRASRRGRPRDPSTRLAGAARCRDRRRRAERPVGAATAGQGPPRCRTVARRHRRGGLRRAEAALATLSRSPPQAAIDALRADLRADNKIRSASSPYEAYTGSRSTRRRSRAATLTVRQF